MKSPGLIRPPALISATPAIYTRHDFINNIQVSDIQQEHFDAAIGSIYNMSIKRALSLADDPSKVLGLKVGPHQEIKPGQYIGRAGKQTDRQTARIQKQELQSRAKQEKRNEPKLTKKKK